MKLADANTVDLLARFQDDGAVWPGGESLQQPVWCLYGAWDLQQLLLLPPAQPGCAGPTYQVLLLLLTQQPVVVTLG